MTMAQCAQRLILGLTGRMIEPLQSRWTPCTVHMAHFTSTATTRNHNASVRAYQYRSNTCQKTDTRSMLGCHGNWCYQPVRFAGHSHWHNIRHTKMANEKIKAKVNSKIIQRIQLALRAGASPNPKMNRDLERAIEEGKSNNVPLTLMMDAVKRITQGLEKGAILMVEARGLGNSFFIIECFTDKPSHTRNTLKFITKKCGAVIVEAGRASHSFEHKGLVLVKPDETNPLDIDKATEIAIEAGAEEVSLGMNDEGLEVLEFYCNTKELHDVKAALEGEGLDVIEGRFVYVPITFAKLSGMDLKYCGELLDLLMDYDDVVRIYDNVAAQEEAESTSN